MSNVYLSGNHDFDTFDFSTTVQEGIASQEGTVTREWTAEEHRVQARRLLAHVPYGPTPEKCLAAAQVHATLAVSLAARESVS
jgi:hypothetical protein